MLRSPSLGYHESHIIPCPAPACAGGEVTAKSRAEYYKSWQLSSGVTHA